MRRFRDFIWGALVIAIPQFAAGEELRPFVSVQSALVIAQVRFLSDGRHLAATGFDGGAGIYSIGEAQPPGLKVERQVDGTGVLVGDEDAIVYRPTMEGALLLCKLPGVTPVRRYSVAGRAIVASDKLDRILLQNEQELICCRKSDGKEVYRVPINDERVWFPFLGKEFGFAIVGMNHEDPSISSTEGVFWRATDGKRTNTYSEKPITRLASAAFSADVRRASFTFDNRPTRKGVVLWDLQARREIASIGKGVGLEYNVSSFSPDGSRLAVAGVVREVSPPPRSEVRFSARLWIYDVASQREIGTFQEENYLNALAFNDSGQRLAVGAENGMLHIFDLEPLKAPSP